MRHELHLEGEIFFGEVTGWDIEGGLQGTYGDHHCSTPEYRVVSEFDLYDDAGERVDINDLTDKQWSNLAWQLEEAEENYKELY